MLASSSPPTSPTLTATEAPALVPLDASDDALAAPSVVSPGTRAAAGAGAGAASPDGRGNQAAANAEKRRAVRTAAKRLEISLYPVRAEPTAADGDAKQQTPPGRGKAGHHRPRSQSGDAADPVVGGSFSASPAGSKSTKVRARRLPKSPTLSGPRRLPGLHPASPRKPKDAVAPKPAQLDVQQLVSKYDAMEPRQQLRPRRNPLPSAVPLAQLRAGPTSPPTQPRIGAATVANLRELAALSMTDAAKNEPPAVLPGDYVDGVLTSPVHTGSVLLSPGTRGRRVKLRSPKARLRPLDATTRSSVSPTAPAGFAFFGPDYVPPASADRSRRPSKNRPDTRGSVLSTSLGTDDGLDSSGDASLWLPSHYGPPTAAASTADGDDDPAATAQAWQTYLSGSSCLACSMQLAHGDGAGATGGVGGAHTHGVGAPTVPVYAQVMSERVAAAKAKAKHAYGGPGATTRKPRRSGYGGRYRPELVDML